MRAIAPMSQAVNLSYRDRGAVDCAAYVRACPLWRCAWRCLRSLLAARAPFLENSAKIIGPPVGIQS